MPDIDPKYLLTIKGRPKPHVIYAGLLDAAHQRGLSCIACTLVQIPSADNDHLAICHATVTLTDGNGVQRRFDGIGDASPQSVGPQFAPVLVRFAATRAQARALRDAINLGGDDPEELEPDLADAATHLDVQDSPAPKAQTPPSAAPSPSAAAPAAAAGPTPAPAANAVIAAHPVNQPPGTIRSVAVARAEAAQADERLSLALGYRARPAPDKESQLRGHLVNLLRAAELNSIPLHLSHQPAALNPALLGPAILEVETRIKTALADVDLGTIQPAVPPKAKVAAG